MKINYRPEIDGLRSIAVISVIIYHAQITLFGNQFLPGGYIGVDIFFVISGYLITSIILKELKLKGQFSFINFYQRRARRILPALFFVMLASIPLGWYFLSYTNFVDFAESILFSLLFSSNFYFHFTGIEYDSVPSIFLPFLHTWSLSIEEQYYIIFPIVLLLLYKFFRKNIAGIFVFILIISLVFAHFGSLKNQSESFYFLHTRFWELMFGSILAYFEIKKNFRSKNHLSNFYLPIIGIILIIYSMFFFNHNTLHPSIYTIIPILGVGMIIWYSDKKDPVKIILSSKIFVSIGLISYSLYLWHYPIFAFSRIAQFTQGNVFKQVIIALIIFIFSFLTYQFIEKPFRNKKNKFRKVFGYLLIIAVSIFSLSTIIILKNGFKYDVPESLNIDNFDYRYKEVELYKQCHRNFNVEKDFCTFGNNEKSVYLVGDSQLISIMYDLKNKLNNNNLNLVSMTSPGQVLLFNKVQKDKDKKYQKYRLEKLSKIKNSIIIIGGKYSLHDNNFLENEIKSYKKFFREMTNLNNKIILLGPIPIIDNPYDIKKMGRNEFSKFKKKGFEDQFISKERFFIQSKNTKNFLNNFKNKNIFYIDLEKIFCDSNACYSVKNKNVLLSDDDHPSIYAAKLINNLLLDKIKNIVNY